MSVALLFPGQGARRVLEAVAVARALPGGARLLDLARSVVDADPEAQGGRALERTEVLQPVLTAVSLAVHGALAEAGVTPALVLGHSLGEVAAFAAAGAWDAEAAVRLAARRGQLMAEAARAHPGGLVALPSAAAAEALCGSTARAGIAAWNAPDEVVVWADAETLPALLAHGRRVPVAGAWHSPLMREAVAGFHAALASTPRRAPRIPLVRCADGAVAPETADAALELAGQLTSPVRYTSALETARARGVGAFVTVGPGAVLRGLVRRSLGAAATVLTTEDAKDLARTLAALRSTR